MDAVSEVWAVRLREVMERASDADGRFVYGVVTTGIFCRPSCPSRRPRPENVALFDTAGEAVLAGYRPCKRCRPGLEGATDGTVTGLVEACRILAGEPASTGAVAAAVGWSEGHLGRCFKRHLGVTPQAYARRVRAERGRAALASGASVIDAVFAAGYGASSRFYAGVGRELGMAPAEARAGAPAKAVWHVVVPCSLGRLLVAWTTDGVCRVSFGDDDDVLTGELRAQLPKAEHRASPATAWADAIVAAVERPCALGVPLDVRGTAFQERVWQALRTIEVGETVTYAELAARLGKPTAARAVARACATNAVAVVVPCHRVVGSDGALRGYRWGLERKAELLRRERGG